MTWTWVRPADPGVLAGRPLLDLGTGDGQTVLALAPGADGVVGLDVALPTLRAARRAGLKVVVAAGARRLPFRSASFGTVLAGDLFHHLDDAALAAVLAEVLRVLRPAGSLVAWWYARPGRPAPDAPRFPRALESVAHAITAAGFATVRPLELVAALDGPQTVGVVAETC